MDAIFYTSCSSQPVSNPNAILLRVLEPNDPAWYPAKGEQLSPKNPPNQTSRSDTKTRGTMWNARTSICLGVLRKDAV